MPKFSVSSLRHYGVALGSVALATLGRRLFDPILSDHVPFVTYFLAVVFTAWYGGLGPAAVSIVLGALSASYFFIPPRGAFAARSRCRRSHAP